MFDSTPLFLISRFCSPLHPDTPPLQIDLSSSQKARLWWQEELPHALAFHSFNSHKPTHTSCTSHPVDTCTSRPVNTRTSHPVNKASDTSLTLRPAALSNELNEDNQSEDSNMNSDDGKIPKPAGEAGRSGRGGYNLEQAVKLNTRDFKKIKNYVYRLIAKHLDQGQCISKQERGAVRNVERQTVLEFPELDNYDKLWPVTDLIKMRLKYTAARCK